MKEISYVTENGIQIYGMPNPSQHGFYISLFLRAGSMYESEGECGITHFLEHALIRNVNRLTSDELYSTLDKYGMEFNASTYAEMVQFYISGADKNIKKGIEIITGLLNKIVLDKADIDSERRRIKAEIRESGDRTSLATFASSFVNEGTTLSKTITGTLGSVSKIGRAQLEEYRKSVFTKENIFFYITGNYTDGDLSTLAEAVSAYDIPNGKYNENIAPMPKSFGKRELAVNIKNADFTAVRFAFDIDMSKVSVAETDLLYDVLVSGYNSKFFIELSEKRGLFYDVSGSLERYKNIGALNFTFEVRQDMLYDALAATVGVLRSLKREILEESECMKAGYVDNAYMLYDDYRELNFTFSYDNHIMDTGYDGLEARRRAYDSVTPERLREVAGSVFTLSNMTFAMKGNKKRCDKEKIKKILSELG